jgi:ABC-type uncharacterized transport system substrate-binding protein
MQQIRIVKQGCLGCLILLGLCNVDQASAHPHVWITMTEELLFAPDGKLTAVANHWTFDEGYSAYAVQGVPTQPDGSIARETLDVLAKSNTEALEEFGYFTTIRSDGKKLVLDSPKDYSLNYDGHSLTYTMTLPVKEPMKPGKVTFIEIYDPTYFVSFSFADQPDPVAMTTAPKGCALTVARPKQDPQPSQNLSEAFFNSLSAGSNFGAQFSSRIVLACP